MKKIILFVLIVVSFTYAEVKKTYYKSGALKYEVPFKNDNQPILIQGAMPIEINKYIGRLKNLVKSKIGVYKFYSGTLYNKPIVISLTGVGMVNAATATALGIQHFKPKLIINQGTAGSYNKLLKANDILIVTKSFNIGSYITPYKKKKRGFDIKSWRFLSIVMNLNYNLNQINYKAFRQFNSGFNLVNIAYKLKEKYDKYKIIKGTIGSTDSIYKEVDYISLLHTKYGADAGDMETSAVAQVSKALNIPFIGFRIISNSYIHNQQYNPTIASKLPPFVFRFIKNL